MNRLSPSGSPVLAQPAVQHKPRFLERPQAGDMPTASLEAAHGPMPTVNLVDLRAQAWRSGFDSGEAAGREHGLREGHAEGRRQGLDEGREEGMRQGLQQAQERVDAEIGAMKAASRQRQAQLLQMLQAFPEQMARTLADAEDGMVALVHAAVLRLLGSAFDVGEGARLVVRRQLEEIGPQVQLTVRVHPDDLQLLHDGVQPAALVGSGLSWEADPHVALGGCIIATREGKLDARLETQVQTFTDMLLATRARARQRSAQEHGQ